MSPETLIYTPVVFDLIWSLPLALLLTGVSRFLRNGLLINLGHFLGVPKSNRAKTVENTVLETAYKSGHGLDKSKHEMLSKQTDMSERQVQIWFRKRTKRDTPTEIKKFTESFWRLCLRLPIFLMGLFILWKKSWFWETKHAWINWPHHEVTPDLYCYYILQLSVYFHFLLTSPTDNKRKDFLLSVTHHISTVILMCFGWIFNFVRIGTLVLLVNDAPDPWIELSKILVYSRRARLSEISFVIFITVWLVGKDGIYIFRFLYSTVFEAYEYLPVSIHVRVFFNFFLFVVMALNIIWTFSIFQVIAHKLRHGELKDVRSDSE